MVPPPPPRQKPVRYWPGKAPVGAETYSDSSEDEETTNELTSKIKETDILEYNQSQQLVDNGQVPISSENDPRYQRLQRIITHDDSQDQTIQSLENEQEIATRYRKRYSTISDKEENADGYELDEDHISKLYCHIFNIIYIDYIFFPIHLHSFYWILILSVKKICYCLAHILFHILILSHFRSIYIYVCN